MRKACIVETTVDNAPILKRHLPPNVGVAQQCAPFGPDKVELCLEGDRLPAWCEVLFGGNVARATADLLDDGTLRLIPGSGLPMEQVPAHFKGE